MLMPPIPDKEMVLHMSTTQVVLGPLLGQLDDKKKKGNSTTSTKH